MSSLALVVLVALIGSIHCKSGVNSIPTDCREKVMDVFFVMDSSASIYVDDFHEQRQFVRQMVTRFDISDRFTRVGAISISDDVKPPGLGLTASRSHDDVLRSITEVNLPYRPGTTNTHRAIRYVRELSEFRPDITKLMVLIIKGSPTKQGFTAREAQLAREQGFYVFVVGLGQIRDMNWWRIIASTPSDRFIYKITKFKQLSSVANTLPSQIYRLQPHNINSCSVKHNVEVIFAAGPTQNSMVLDLVEEFVEIVHLVGGLQVRYTPFMDTCYSAAIQLDLNRLKIACSRRKYVGVLDELTYTNLLNKVKSRINRNTISFRPIRNAVVMFMDAAAFDRFGYLGEELLSLDENLWNVDVVFVGLGLSEKELASMAKNVPKAVNFNLSDVSYQYKALTSFFNQTCQAINSEEPTIQFDQYIFN